MYKTSNLTKIKGFEGKNFLRDVIFAVKNGWTLLIEDIGEEIVLL